MPVTRLELATATIVRADTVDVPAEARAAEGSGAAGWEPTFLAAARVSAGRAGPDEPASPDAGARAVEAFRQLITTLRLFKAGGVGLGPYAWTRAGGRPLAPDRDRRRAPAAGRLPPGRGRSSATSPPSRGRSPTARPRSGASAQSGPGSRARWRARSPASRPDSSATWSSRRSTTTCWRSGSCSRAAARPTSACRCGSRRSAPSPSIATRPRRSSTGRVGLERELWSGEPAPAGRGRHDARRDRGRARGPGAGDPQGRRLRAPRSGPARDRRRDPARRRPRGRRRWPPSSVAARRVGPRPTRPPPTRRLPTRPADVRRRARGGSPGRASLNDDPADAVETPEPEPRSRAPGVPRIDLPGEWHEDERAEEPNGAGAGARRANHRRVTPQLGGGARVRAPAPRREPEPTTVDEVDAAPAHQTRRVRSRTPHAEQTPSRRGAQAVPTPRARRRPLPAAETTEWNVREMSYDRRRRARFTPPDRGS